MTDRAEAVAEALAELEWPEDGPLRIETAAGPVDLARIAVEGDCVEVTVDNPSSGEPQYRIFNPPVLVRAPDGTLRLDPIGAVAEAVAMFGGRAR